MGRQIETIETEIRIRSIMARFLTTSPTFIMEQMDRVFDQLLTTNVVSRYVKKIRAQDQEVFSGLAAGGLIRLATDETLQINEEIAETKSLISEAQKAHETREFVALHKTLLDLRERRQVVLQNMIVYPHLQRTANAGKTTTDPAKLVKEAAAKR